MPVWHPCQYLRSVVVQLKQVHILEWGSGKVAINLCLIYVFHRPPLTVRSGSGRNSDQDWADRMQEVQAWCQGS
jgi:hypothetical protein